MNRRPFEPWAMRAGRAFGEAAISPRALILLLTAVALTFIAVPAARLAGFDV